MRVDGAQAPGLRIRGIREFSVSAPGRKDKSNNDDEGGTVGGKKEGEKDKEAKEKETAEEKGKRAAERTKKASSAAAEGGAKSSGYSGTRSGNGNDGKSGRNKALSKPSVPEVYPQVMCLPIAKRPLFPGFYKAVTIRDPDVAAAIQEMMRKGQPYLGAFLLRDENADSDTIERVEDVYPVGVFAQITSISNYPTGPDGETSLTAVLYPHRRIKINELYPPPNTQATEGEKETTPSPQPPAPTPAEEERGDVVASFDQLPADEAIPLPLQTPHATSFLKKHNVTLVDVENLEELPYERNSQTMKAYTSEIVNVFKDIAQLNPLFRDQISTFAMSQTAGNMLEEPAKLADFAAAVSSGEVGELQEVLETMDIEERLQKSLVVLKKELMNAQLQSKISKDVEAKIQKRQREYWLMEQMKGIRRELGIESDGKDKLVEKFKEKGSKLAMPEAVKKVFDEELNKLAHLEQAASEFNVTRNYLDWLTQIPWGMRSAENYNIANARKVLDEDHYGLQDVKERILEFIAVGKLRGTVEGKIICFVGPPGVGKTSIGKSIARALNRQFYRFSVGGLTDVAEIKGHRRTYVGALPGRIIQALKKCQTENPLILIDEGK